MKRVNFENGKITQNILGVAMPMLVAQLISLLYNVIDRIYIARIPDVGTAALGGVGLCFPITIIITAFSNLFGSGGSPLFSIRRGMGDDKTADTIMNTAFTMLCGAAIILMAVGMIFARPLLVLFGASESALTYAYPYMMIYLLGTLPSMVSTGMNPFINAQGYSVTGMLTVAVGAAANCILDPVFIFVLHLGVRGAAIATVISQIMSAAFVLYFLKNKAELQVKLLSLGQFRECVTYAKDIVSLGTAGFVMQLTNSLVSICCNSVLSRTGGDVYVSVMTIVSSVRQIVETPIWSIAEGASPVISYNYGARNILIAPGALIAGFSSDSSLISDSIPALKIYFAAFAFMLLQYIGQTTFKSLNKKKQAIFFSLLRKAIIVVPLTYLLPYAFHLGTNGVFMAEPISNILGGSACFFTMLLTVIPELNRMKK